MRSKLILILALTIVPFPVHALTLGFECITNNRPADAAIGEAQLFVDVTDYGNDQVLFTFRNTGPAASSIADVYFDDGTLLGIASIIDGTGVDFEIDASPGDLPGGKNIEPDFKVSQGFFSADSEPPTQPNGVNPDEWLQIVFNLQPGKTFGDVLGDLDSRDLRIGIHVQGFENEGSESFVNTIPDATTLSLLGSAMLIAALFGWRRKVRKG
jgi:hypothetical protein